MISTSFFKCRTIFLFFSQQKAARRTPARCWRSLSPEGEQVFFPEVHDQLHSFEHVQLQVVNTSPDSQLLNLLSVSRLVTFLNEADQCGVVCKLQELDRGVFGCAGIGVEGEEQWGENTALRSSSADRTGAG